MAVVYAPVGADGIRRVGKTTSTAKAQYGLNKSDAKCFPDKPRAG